MTRFVYVSPKFWRIGFRPWAIVVCHRDDAIYSIRKHGWRIGKWFLVIGR